MRSLAAAAVASVLLTGLALTACTSSTPRHPTPSLARVAGWQEIALPAKGARILVLAALGDKVLALGSVPGPSGRAPAAWTTTDARVWHRLRLTAATGYGQQAEFVMAGVAAGHVSAYGQAFGGAHSSPRPTLWTGDGTGLTEHEQSFTMFGGEDAISVAAETAGPGQVLLAGSWDGRSGRYGAAVWTSPDGATWTRYADVPNLASGPGEQTAAYGAAATPSGFLVIGDTQRGGAAFTTTALAWTSADGHSWRRIRLPSNGNAIASRAACDSAGCVVLGSTETAQQHLLCWTLTTSSRAPHAADGPGHGLVEVGQALLVDRQVYVISDVDRVATLDVADRDCGGWTSTRLPAADPHAVLVQLAGHLVLATTGADASRLWLRA